MSEPLKGFITYSHENIGAKNELRKRLAVARGYRRPANVSTAISVKQKSLNRGLR